MRQGSQRTASARSFPFGGESDIGSMLADMLGGSNIDLGKPIAKGADNIISKLEEIAKKPGSGVSQDIIDDLKAQMDGEEDVQLFEVPGGGYGILHTSIKMPAGLEGLDMESLVSAIRFSDRHGGRSAFEDIGEAVHARLREAQERMRSPIGEFMRALKLSEQDEPQIKSKKSDSPTGSILMAAGLTAVVLSHHARWQNPPEKAVAAAEGLAKLLDDLQQKQPVRFGNMVTYLKPYSVDLYDIARKLGQFAARPHPEVAKNLASDLAMLAPALVNVVRDAQAKAKEVSDAARAI